MPRKAKDYSKTAFYKIVCKDNAITDCYVGHSVNVYCRKLVHANNCYAENRRTFNYKVYKFIRDHGGWDNWNFEVIETINCINDVDAKKREAELHNILGATLNIQKPISNCSAEQKEKNAAYFKLWREAHPDYYKEWHKIELI